MINAKWITPADCPAEGTAAFWVKRNFEVGSVPQSSVLQITADSFYTAYLNGREIARGPIRGNREIQFYDEIEVAPFLQCGKNELKIFVYCVGEENFTIEVISKVFN